MSDKQRDYIYYDWTQTLCPKCLKLVNTKIIFENSKVYQLKRCPEHGEIKIFISIDEEYYRKCRDFVKPSEMPNRWNTEIKKGCPFDCGLCPDHEQHSCVTVLEITEKCNLDCRVCYSSSGTDVNLKHRTMTEIEYMLDQIMLNEGMADIVQISGGEPTIHPNFFEILDLARTKNIRHLMINTNGVKIANEDGFAEKLLTYMPGIEIYLQFDGLTKDVSENLRGIDLTNIRKKALNKLNEINLSTTLVTVVKKGINAHEIGEVIKIGIESKAVRGVTFQPIQEEGRIENYNQEENRLTLSEVRKNIIEQSLFIDDDIIPVPCHPDALAMGYALKLNGSLVPLTRMIDPDILLEGRRNTIVLESDEDLKAKVLDVLSAAHSPESAKDSLMDLLCCLPQVQVDVPENITYENVFRIIIMEFADRYNLDVRSVKKSCVHIAHTDGRIIPFETFNIFNRVK